MCVYLYMGLYMGMCALRGQRRASDTPELEL